MHIKPGGPPPTRVSEDDLLRAVIDLADQLGVHVHHCRPARTERGWVTPIQGDAGFPDLVLAGPGGVLFAELKSGEGRMTKHQSDWRVALAKAGATVVIWRPADMASGDIPTEMQRLARGPLEAS